MLPDSLAIKYVRAFFVNNCTLHLDNGGYNSTPLLIVFSCERTYMCSIYTHTVCVLVCELLIPT